MSSELTCRKCGGSNLGATYHVGRYGPPDNRTRRCGMFDLARGDVATEPEYDREHIHRYCNTCGFDWRTAVHDR